MFKPPQRVSRRVLPKVRKATEYTHNLQTERCPFNKTDSTIMKFTKGQNCREGVT